MRRAVVLLCAWVAMPAWATTYYFVGGVDHVRTDHTTCNAGSCANFPAGARITGSFTTAAPFAANLPPAEVYALVTSYSFSDGVTSYSSANANARLFQFTVGTDAAGLPTGVILRIQQWQAGGTHDATNDRYDELQVSGLAAGVKNFGCASFGPSPNTTVADTCQSSSASTDTSSGLSTFPQQWSIDAPIVVPPNVATTYYVASGPYTTRTPHATCTIGLCADFPLGGRLAGSFTTAARIPPGIAPTEVSGLVTSFQFGDGPTTFTSADAQTRVASFQVGTDAGGVPGGFMLQLQRWQGGGSHAVGDRLDVALLTSGPFAAVNLGCATMGANDTCSSPGSLTDDGSVAISQLGVRASIGAPLSLALVPTTYSAKSVPYTTITNHTTCALGACADFTSAMRLAGTFTLADRLPPNFPLGDVSGLVADHSIDDGVTTFSGADPLGRIILFRLATGASGIPADAAIGLLRWQGGAAPHLAGSRADFMTLTAAGGIGAANGSCGSDATRSLETGAIDVCGDLDPDNNTSIAYSEAAVAWSILSTAVGAAAAVPGPSGGALALLAAMIVAAAAIRRRRASGGERCRREDMP